MKIVFSGPNSSKTLQKHSTPNFFTRLTFRRNTFIVILKKTQLFEGVSFTKELKDGVLKDLTQFIPQQGPKKPGIGPLADQT